MHTSLLNIFWGVGGGMGACEVLHFTQRWLPKKTQLLRSHGISGSGLTAIDTGLFRLRCCRECRPALGVPTQFQVVSMLAKH